MKKPELEDLKEFIETTVYQAVSQSETHMKDELKEFMMVTVSQSEARMTEKLFGVEGRLDFKITALRKEMLGGFYGVGDAIDNLRGDLEKYQIKTDRWLERLELKVL